jgi:hypothetical protein
MSEDLSPSSRPFQAKLDVLRSHHLRATAQASLAVFDFVDVAKRMLLELKVRDFTAADVVALAALIESRDRYVASLSDSE